MCARMARENAKRVRKNVTVNGERATEAQIQKSILDWLAAEHILAFRMNSGAVKSEHNGKQRFFRFGTPGMADILSFPFVLTCRNDVGFGIDMIFWIEVKDEKGKQSELQKSFQEHVESYGHRYILVRSLEEVKKQLGRN